MNKMKFDDFNFRSELMEGIRGAGYTECTPVQEQVFKAALEGRDLYVQSQTGTGKTAAYLVSIIQELLEGPHPYTKKVLVLAPTRELAVQIYEEAKRLSRATDIRCAVFFGGVGYDKQISELKQGCDIIIGTPGRVIDLNRGDQMDLSNVGYLVIDEADRMFDMGFYDDLRTLLKVLPKSEARQTMLLSATLNTYVKNLAWEYTKNPEEITINADLVTVEEIEQQLLHVSSDEKMRLLLTVLEKEKPESTLIFCNTKKTCEIVAKRLRLNGVPCEYIIGDLPQTRRLAIMDRFKAGKVKCLVATDVAARGIDVNDLAMVINYDLPSETENYVHRIGRTARAGKHGKAISFCSEQDVYSLPAIERFINAQIPSEVVDPSSLLEDKSRGVYIKLETYREGYNDKSEYGRKRQAEYDSRRRAKSAAQGATRRAGGAKGSGRYSQRNQNETGYKRDRRVYSADEKLASMTEEERMKFYKERYAGSQNKAAAKGAAGKGAQRTAHPAPQAAQSRPQPAAQETHSAEKAPKRLSFFKRIRALFKK